MNSLHRPAVRSLLGRLKGHVVQVITAAGVQPGNLRASVLALLDPTA